MDQRSRATVGVALGGATGSLVRHGITSIGSPQAMVLVCNIVGSLVLGYVLGRPAGSRFGGVGITVGFCGGLTTMSSWAVLVALDVQAGAWGTALGWLVATVVAVLGCVWVGFTAGRSW